MNFLHQCSIAKKIVSDSSPRNPKLDPKKLLTKQFFGRSKQKLTESGFSAADADDTDTDTDNTDTDNTDDTDADTDTETRT